MEQENVIKNISIRNLDVELMRRVRILAASRNVHLGEVVNEALEIGLTTLERVTT